jgi:DNA-binding transcriptional LysR family regulator
VSADPLQGGDLPGLHVRVLGREPAERQGHPVRIGYVTDQPDAWLAAIANRYGIALAPESATRYYARPGITYRPVTGVSPSQACVAWPPANDTDPVVRDFVRCCLDARD